MLDLERFPHLPEPDRRTVELLVKEVTGLDADGLRAYPWRPVTADEAATGLRLNDHESTLARLRDNLQTYVEPDAVWMDATTLYRARRLLADEPSVGRQIFDPLALLDLDTFIRNFVMYDQIVAVRNDADTEWADMRPLNEAMHEAVFVSLLPDGPPDPTVEELFHHLFFTARDWVDGATSGRRDPVMGGQFAAWRSSARRIYGTVPDGRAETQLTQDWGSVADYVAHLLMQPDRGPVSSVMGAQDEESQHELIAEATVRAVFNADLARGLDLRYSAAAARLPTVASYDHARAFTAAEALGKEMDNLRDERLEELTKVHRDVQATPVWVAILLSRAERAADLWPELVALRQETASLRARRRALDTELNGNREEQALRELREALRAESVDLMQAWGATAAYIALGVTASALTGGPWGFGFVGGLAAMLGAELISDQPHKLRARLLKPRQAQVTHLGSQIRGLRQSLPKAQHLWGFDEATADAQAEAYSRMEPMRWL